jgi:hypothetical protein
MSQDERKLHNADALRALANGEILPGESEEHENGRRPSNASQIAPGQYSSDSGQSDSSEAEDSLSWSVPADGATRKSRRNANMARRQNYHAGIQFRKTFIPLLLVMAMILIAVGIATLVKVKGSSPEAIANSPFLDNGSLFAGISITLGLCLIVGSAIFHYEIRKHHRETNGGGKK